MLVSNNLIIPLIIIAAGEICLLLDLGSRLFGSYARTPVRALVRISIVVVAGYALALPLLLSMIQTETAWDGWLTSSCVVSGIIIIHFVFPYRFGIRRVKQLNALTTEQSLTENMVLKKIAIECHLPMTKTHSICCLILSDLHCNSESQLHSFQDALGTLRQKTYDLILVLGDLGEKNSLLPEILSSIGELESIYGTYCVRGNHDCEHQRDEMIEQWAHERSLILLSNQVQTMEKLGISVLGLEHPWRPGALPAESQTPFTLGLTHTPDNITLFDKLHVPLVLAGHTHGGKFTLPLLGPLLVPTKYGRFLNLGWFRRRNTFMYINEGVGYFPDNLKNKGTFVELNIKSRKS